MRQRYVLAERPERSQLLDEMAQVTALHHKSLLRLLAGELTRQPRGAPRPHVWSLGGGGAASDRRELRLPVCRTPDAQLGLDGPALGPAW